MTSPLALYVHWPFCVSKCPYCDFNSHVRAAPEESAWRRALLDELDHEMALTPGRRLGSIFFGGGTPSLMHADTVAAIIERAEALWGFGEDIEITLEANPSSVEAVRFAGFAAAGVNRLSLGLQALNDADLKALGRAHDVREGLAALDAAQRYFARTSIDLIYAREGQRPEDWEAELARALAFGTEHLSLYQLTIEPGTHFAGRHRRGDLALPPEEESLAMFEMTRALTAAKRRPAYEVSNHAAPGAESRHNLTYWRYGDYVGVGPGAHGRRGRRATVRERLPERWLRAVQERGHGLSEERELDARTRAEEALMMGLRLAEGLDADLFAAATGTRLADAVDARGAAQLESLGMLERGDDGMRLTPAGRPLVDAALTELLG